MENKFTLEIYAPGSTMTTWEVFESDTPFLAINKGDLINPGVWEGSQSPMKILRVVNLEHIIWKSINSKAKHKLLVYTEEIEGTEENRISIK